MSHSKPLEEILESIQRKIKKAGSDIDESIASEMVHNYGKDLGILGARVWKIKKDYIVLRDQKGGRKKLRPGFKVPITYPPVQEILSHGFTITNKDYPGFNKEIESSIGSENSLALRITKDMIMAIEVDNIMKAKPALQLLRIALDSSIKKRKMDGIDNLARKVEESLLPREKDLIKLKESYDVSWYAKPADIVRGDYLRFRPMDDKSAAIIIGDAEGKGFSASIVAQSVHIALESLTSHNLRAAALMKTINETLCKTDITKELMTLFYSTLTPKGAISYVCAGHPPPFLFYKDGIKRLSEGGTVLGAKPDANYIHGVAEMSKGDILFLYTDGLYEVKGQNGEYLGINGLEELVGSYRNLSASEIRDKIIKEVKDYAINKKLSDDVTFAVVKKKS